MKTYDKKGFEQLLEMEHSVEVDGIKIELEVPELSAATAIRKRLMKVDVGEDGKKVKDPGKTSELIAECGASAICACVGCTLPQASKLFLISGGEQGDLYQKCMSLCGMEMKLDAQEAALVDPPS